MSQNPYSQFDAGNPGASQDQSSGPAKTSGLAIGALVCSLVFCLPLGIVGVILGVIAYILIGGSQGRSKGRGLAIAAVLIGIVSTTLWVGGMGLAFRMGYRYQTQVVEPSYAAFRKLDSGDVAGFRELLAPNVASNITDAEILAFRDAYQAAAGQFVGESKDFSNMFTAGLAVADPVVLQKFKTGASDELMSYPAAFTNQQGAIIIKSESVKNATSYALGNPSFKGSVVEVAVFIQGKPPIVLTDVGANTAPAPDKKPDAPSPGGNGG